MPKRANPLPCSLLVILAFLVTWRVHIHGFRLRSATIYARLVGITDGK